jgi:outer membrane protein assembly factor BamD (BamD/ComL family)
LRKEAGEYLERKIHLGEMTREEATPLFERIVVEQSRWEEPASLLAICEMAIRSGIRTPWVLYSYGTGLRSTGRLSDAKAILSQIKADNHLHPFALYALGQIAEEEENGETALELFRRVRLLAKDRPALGFLDRRVARSEAELLIVTGRSAEAVPLYEDVLSQTKDPLVKIGMEAARKESPGKEGALHPERIAGLPTRERILLSLLLGGLSMERGEYDSAVAHITRAEEDLQSSLLSGVPPASERLEEYKSKELLDRQIGVHAALRQELSTQGKGENPETVRDTMVELLLGNLFMDHVLSRSVGSMPAAPTLSPIPVSSSRQIEEVFQKIEQVTLGGVSVDELVEDIARKIEIFQNIAHPLPRFRLLTKLAKSHEEILLIKERIRKRREDAIAGVQTGNAAESSQLFGDLGRFLAELDKTRKVASEAREFMKRNFDVLKNPGKGKKESSGEIQKMVPEVLAFDDERFASLLPSIQALEERTRFSSWERKRQEILVLRPVVLRHLADAHVARAFSLRENKASGWSERAPAILEKAGSYLSEEGISLEDKAEIAINIGSFLIPGEGRWEPHPGRKPGEAYRKLIERILPWLEDGGASGGNRERRHYVRSLLKISIDAPDASSTARDFLAKYPSSPLVGDIAVRMGNDAILAGRLAEATGFYRMAANVDRPGPSSIARYMLGWVRYHDGDSEGAAEELVHSLSDPSFSCENLAPFEKSVLTLAVRTWMDLPPERLDSFSPVMEGRCGGKLLLTSLGKAEERRGETSRAAAVFDVLASRFSGDEATLTYEMKSVEDLLRAGRDDEAFPRAMRLKEKYGPGSSWAEAQPIEVREMAWEKLAEMLEAISERKFEEGLRSGKRSTMAAAAAGMEKLFAVREHRSDESKAELRFKWAIASIKSGDREKGIGILKSLLTGQQSGPIAEKAAILYADMVIAGYERKEEKAEDAEKAALLLLDRFSSEKAVSLAYRAATDMLGTKEYGRAARIAEALEADKNTPVALLAKARLVQAEAHVFMKEPANARGKADQIFAAAKGKGVEPKDLERAKDLFLLSSLKEVEARTAENDWIGAAKMLEDLIGRFPEAKETPMYALRAVRSYREGGDPEGAMRMATLFLRKYPRREEGVEIAGIVGRDLEDRQEYLKAADVYAQAAAQFPSNSAAGQFLFHAARLSRDYGDPKNARIRFSSYRDRYPAPRWMNAYAALSLGLLDWKEGKIKEALRVMEAELRRIEAGVEPDAPKEFFEVAGKAQIAIGEHWAEQFRRLKLAAPLEKTLAIKDRFFRRSLEAFEKAERKAPLEVALSASQLSGDLLVEFGKAVLASQRPKGMTKEEQARYEDALAGRARPFFERSLDWYVGAIDRLEAEQGPSDLAISIRQRLEEAQRLLAGLPAPQGEK